MFMEERFRTAYEPRAHHFTPQCWLAGFTDCGRKDGKMVVTDLLRQKQWPTTPPNAGHRRDFYRVEGTPLDPVWFERAFARIDELVAPVLRNLYDKPFEPGEDELDALLCFVAVQLH
jgi:hypothetical protein